MSSYRTFIVLSAVFLFCASVANSQSGVRAVDWSGFTYDVGGKKVVMKSGLQVGACEAKDEDGIPTGDIWNVDPANVAYGDLDGDGKEEAAIPMVANVCSGSMITDEALLVYTTRGGSIVKLPEFDFHDEGCAEGSPGCNFWRTPGVAVAYDKNAGSLIVTTFFATADDALCCPSLERGIRYKWNGTAFAETRRGKVGPARR